MTELLMQLKAFLLWALLLVPPFVLTALNLWNLFAECSGRRKLAPRVFAGLSMGIGAAEYFLLLCVEFEYSGKDYDQATYTFQTHNLIDSSHALSFWLPVLVGIVGLVLLLWCRPEQLPPLVSAGAECRTGRSSQVSGLVFLPLSRQSAAVVCDGNPPAYRRTDKASAGTTDSIPAALGASAVSVFRKDVTFSAGCLFAGAAPCGSAGNSADSLRTRCRRHSSSVYPDGGLDIFTAASAASFGI